MLVKKWQLFMNQIKVLFTIKIPFIPGQNFYTKNIHKFGSSWISGEASFLGLVSYGLIIARQD